MPRAGERSLSFGTGTHARGGSWHVLAACAWITLLGACERDETFITATTSAPLKSMQFVTGNAARNLNGEGRFNVNATASHTGVATITAERAGELALANVRTYASSFREGWEKDRGAPIDVGSLKVDPRIFYAETPYGRFPDGYHPAYRRSFGPYFLVRLVSGSTPVMIVAVSAYNTDVRIDDRGKVRVPAIGGDEFFEVALPAQQSSGFQPVQPEEAVERVGHLTGKRTAEVPVLLLRGSTDHPAAAVWKVSLDGPVRVKDTKGTRRLSTQTVYVGPGGRLFVPAGSQSQRERGVFRTTPSKNASGKAMGEVPIRGGAPAAFDEVVVDQTER